MDVALMIEGQNGLNWPRWQRLVRAAEDLGFAGIYRSDHFSNKSGAHLDALELWVSLTWAAANTKRIQFGPLVSPVSFRHPVVTAWSAAAVDDLSGGRLQLGMGAGWQEREHRCYGFDLLDVAGRFRRLEEGLEIVRLLMHGESDVAFDGHFFHLEEAQMLPRPQRAGGPPIVIGGNGIRRTLPLAARYAQEWNAVFATAERFVELSAELDRLLVARGRAPGDVRRSLMTRAVVASTRSAADAKVTDADQLRSDGCVIGDPADAVVMLRRYADAGVQRVMLQWLELDDLDGIELIAREVLPALAG